jgi:hypothetical protein
MEFYGKEIPAGKLVELDVAFGKEILHVCQVRRRPQRTATPILTPKRTGRVGRYGTARTRRGESRTARRAARTRGGVRARRTALPVAAAWERSVLVATCHARPHGYTDTRCRTDDTMPRQPSPPHGERSFQ